MTRGSQRVDGSPCAARTRRARGSRAADQPGQPVPGGAEVGPAQGALQVHPQPRRDRVRPDHREADRLQPCRGQHAGRAVGVGADGLQRPDVPPDHQPGGRLDQLPPDPLAAELLGHLGGHDDRGVRADRSGGEGPEPRHVLGRGHAQMPDQGVLLQRQHPAVAPVPGHRLGPLGLDRPAVQVVGRRGQIGQAGLPEGAPDARLGERRQVGRGHRAKPAGSHGRYLRIRGLASPSANPSVSPQITPAPSHSDQRTGRVVPGRAISPWSHRRRRG